MSSLLYFQQYGALFEARVSTTVPVNAWQGRVVLPSDLNVQDIAYGAGIGEIWQTPPALSSEGNWVDFVGGTTVGFSGDGLLFQFTAVPPVRSEQLLGFDAARTRLYGGAEGESVPTRLLPLTVNAEDLRASTSTVVQADTTSPQPFEISLFQDARIFNGKTAIIFHATDRESGIDHYEVEEHVGYGVIGWHPAASPYLINADVNTILVKAVDRAGNYRIENIALKGDGFSVMKIALFIALLLVIGLSAVYFIRRRRKHS